VPVIATTEWSIIDMRRPRKLKIFLKIHYAGVFVPPKLKMHYNDRNSQNFDSNVAQIGMLEDQFSDLLTIGKCDLEFLICS